MKIGILTFHSSFNFGANLQTLATQSILQREGVTPVVVNYRDEAKMAAYREMIDPQQAAEHEHFTTQYLKLSPLLHSAREVEEYCLDSLDAIIVGSDAVFRLAAKYQLKRLLKTWFRSDAQYASFSQVNDLNPYWLEWTRQSNKPLKAALAASSRGTSFYFLNLKFYPRLWKCIRDFNYLSVRDHWTQIMVSSLSLGTVKPQLCPDPVFGLNSTFKLPESEKTNSNLSKVILLGGTLNKSWVNALQEEAAKRGFRIGVLANPEDGRMQGVTDIELNLPMSPLSWYHTLASTAGYVGTRFHAFVSCMVNETPVITVDVAKPYLRRQDHRNPNFDLCRIAGTPTRYFLRRTIEQTPARVVLDTLFDADTNLRSNQYASRAAEQVIQIVREIIEKTEALK